MASSKSTRLCSRSNKYSSSVMGQTIHPGSRNANLCYCAPMPYKDPEFARAKQKVYAREHYEKNIDKIKARTALSNKKARKRNAEYIRNIKESSPCEDCGKFYPYYVMHFDHIFEKNGSIANMARASLSIKRIQQEIDGCELVCSNCHAERTHSRAYGSEEDLSEWV